ncbi:MAG: YggS family pyridoxal phosphate-dependent enzyme, partial [Bacteroidetes bacterium]|nr:YggS family pyridoxal phosphate-dependent enzyme [Bacteroidota bacterium]
QIGTLQKNKVKYISSFVHLIHAVDNEELLNTIQKEAQKAGRVIDCLLQVHIANEETKFGFEPSAVTDFISRFDQAEFPNVLLRGLMGMATNTDDESAVRQEFRGLKILFDDLKSAFAAKLPQFDILSMGMSSDYKIAIEEGSTMVRIGSAIFGSR